VIVPRYLFREVLQVFAAVIVVLILIYMSSRFVRYLGQAASGYISSDLVIQLMLLNLAENLAVLLPLGLYIAVLLALGRLYRDSEVIAMSAGGIGVNQLANALFWFASGFALVVAVLALYLGPGAATWKQNLFEKAKGEAQIAGIQPGRFREFGNGNRVVYVERIAADGRSMENVFVQIRRKKGRNQDLIVAKKAYASVQGQDQERFMVLEDGYRYTGLPGELDFVITRFERHAVRMDPIAPPGYRRLESKPSLELIREGGDKNIAELQWRLSLPITVVLLCMLAVAMARTNRNQGRYARLLAAFVLYFLYNNSIGIAQKLIERGELNPWIGVWPVHIVVALLVAAMIYRQGRTQPMRIPFLRRRSA
jgi:lipopolysaccharide export system permease protein